MKVGQLGVMSEMQLVVLKVVYSVELLDSLLEMIQVAAMAGLTVAMMDL